MLTPRSARPDAPVGYGIVPENEGRGLLDWSWAEERLRGRYIWWLATTRPDGRPHLMPVWAVWVNEGVAFSTGAGTRKARNLAHNPFVTIVPERGVESVIVEGEAGPLPIELESTFVAAYTDAYGMDPMAMGEPVYLVKPTAAFGFIDEDDGFPLSATRWTF